MNKLQKIVSVLFGIKAAPVIGGRFQVVNGTVVWTATNADSYIKDGYQGNDIVYSAVKMAEEKIKIAPWGLFKIVDDSSLKLYHGSIRAKDYTAAAKYQRKALEPITNFNLKLGKWKDLLNWPNEFETWGDFVANGAAYKMLTGNKFWWAERLEAGANMGLPNSLYALPPQYMNIIAKIGWPVKVLGYQLNSGQILSFEKEDVMHERYFNPSYDINGSHLMGQSPVQAATKILTKNNYNKEAATSKFQNSGASGIIFIDDDRISAEQAQAQVDAIKSKWSAEYTGANNYGKLVHSGYKTGFTSVTETARDMELIKAEDLDLRRLFNIWGIPSQLGNDPENKAESNMVEGERVLTSRCALPQLTACRDNLNRKKDDWGLKGENVYFDFDLSVYRELQEDQGKKWEWVSQLIIPEADKLEIMGLDVPEELPKDLIIIDGNKMTLSDLLNNITPDQQRQIDDIENEE